MKATPILLCCLCFLFLTCKKESPPISGSNEECSFSAEDSLVLQEINDEFAHAFISSDPNQAEIGLSELIDYIGDAKVVGMGEGTHGSAEFFEMKDKIFRNLVEQKQFKAIVFEIPWGRCLIVDDFVTQGIGSSGSAINQTYYWVYNTEETRVLAEWMNGYNEGLPEADQIHFLGCDPQGGDFTQERIHLQNYLEEVAPEMVDSVNHRYNTLPYSALSEYSSAPSDQHQQNKANTAWVYQFMVDNRDAFVSQTSEYEYEVALMAAHVIQHREMIYRKSSFGETRDSLMAVYTLWWQRILAPDAKIAVWAHNYHVMDNPPPGIKWMGNYLRDSIGMDYRNVGFSFGLGGLNAFLAGAQAQPIGGVQEQEMTILECGTANTLLTMANPDQYFLILEDIKYPSETYSYLQGFQPMVQMGAGFNSRYVHNYTASISIARSWDVLIHFDKVRASQLQ